MSGRTLHHPHPDRVLAGRQGDLAAELARAAVDLGVPSLQAALSEGLWGHAWDEPLASPLSPRPEAALPCARAALHRGLLVDGQDQPATQRPESPGRVVVFLAYEETDDQRGWTVRVSVAGEAVGPIGVTSEHGPLDEVDAQVWAAEQAGVDPEDWERVPAGAAAEGWPVFRAVRP